MPLAPFHVKRAGMWRRSVEGVTPVAASPGLWCLMQVFECRRDRGPAVHGHGAAAGVGGDNGAVGDWRAWFTGPCVSRETRPTVR